METYIAKASYKIHVRLDNTINNNSGIDGAGKDLQAPPPTQINKIKYSPNMPSIKKDKRQSSSRFNIPHDRELQKLPPIRGNYCEEVFLLHRVDLG